MGNYLTFGIAGETCAVGIGDVETVLETVELSRVSGAPDYVAGLLDLRGEGEKRRPVGALVDSVSEVVELADESIAPIGDFAVSFDRDVILGIAKAGSGFVTMIAAERLFEAPSSSE